MLKDTYKIFYNLKKVFENCLETVIESRECMNESNRQLVEKYFSKFINTENGYAYINIKEEELNEEIKNATEFIKEFDFHGDNLIIRAMIKQIENTLTYSFFK